MIATLTAAFFTLASAAVPINRHSLPADTIPAAGLKLTLNREEFTTGEGVRVQVEAAEDGYLIVMRVDGDGRVRVIFPIDPDLDPFVRGGKRYELRGRDASETFKADDLGGAGIVFAALSKDPFHFRDFAIGDHWDYEALSLGEGKNDPEAVLHAFVRRMSNDPRYAFDVQGYRVRSIAYADDYAFVSGYRDPYNDSYYNCLSCGSVWPYDDGFHVGISVGFGSRYVDPWYDPYWSRGYWHTAYRYDPWIDPYWSYGYSPYYPPYYPGQYVPYTVINYRPRPQPNPHAGERARPYPGGFVPHLAPQVGTVAVRPVRDQGTTTRPTPNQDRARPRPDNAGGSIASGVSAGTRPTAPPPQTAPDRRATEDRGTAPRTAPTQSSTGSGKTAPPASSNSGNRARPPAQSGGGQNNTRTDPRNPPVISAGPPIASNAPDRRAIVNAATDQRNPPSGDNGSDRRTEPTSRPVFRDPVPQTPPSTRDRREPATDQRPVYREPDRSPPARSAPPSAEPRRSEPRSVTRTPPPAERRPEPTPRSAPATSSPPRSSSPPPPPPASSTTRARPPGGGR